DGRGGDGDVRRRLREDGDVQHDRAGAVDPRIGHYRGGDGGERGVPCVARRAAGARRGDALLRVGCRRMSETKVDPRLEGAGVATAARPLIRVRGVTRVYDQEGVPVHALRGVDLDIEEGEFTSLAGPSGCGKTTLLNIIGALDRPTSGSVEVAGRDLTRLSKGEAAAFRLENVGFIFQAY